MFYKGLALAGAAALAMLTAFPQANAGPVPAGAAAGRLNGVPVMMVNYDYRYDRYGRDYYDRPPALLALPAEVIGGVMRTVTGVLSAPFQENGYDGPPYYGANGDDDSYRNPYRYGYAYGYRGYDESPFYGNPGYRVGGYAYSDAAPYRWGYDYDRRYYSSDYDRGERRRYRNRHRYSYDRGYDYERTRRSERPYGDESSYGYGRDNRYERPYGYERTGSYDEPSDYGRDYGYERPYDYERASGYERPYGGGGMAACARSFRSFDPASGTYINADGVEVTCPYLGR